LNKQYTKEEYKKKFEEYKLGTFEGREKLYKEWRDSMSGRAIHQFANLEGSQNVTGSMVKYSKNTFKAFDADEVEDCKYATLCVDAKDCMDSYHFGMKSELIYESQGLVRGYNARFTHLCYDDSNIEYCDTCHNSENLFGCVSLKKGSYSILNKKYSEEGYKKLREQIIEDMKERGEYGEFFPLEIAPVSYNETQAAVYMPLSKEEVLEKGWKWEDNMPGTYGKETMMPEDIPDDIKDVQDSILKEILKCVSCDKDYNIVEPELQFYRSEKIPIPRMCPDCRYRRRIALRAPRKLWHGRCKCDYKVYENTTKHSHHTEGRCTNEFETSYPPERKEIVYCEACYQQEVV